jgi:hypothetical protein
MSRPAIRKLAAAAAALLLAASTSHFNVDAASAASGGRSLSVPLVKQSQSQWCWAGTTQSIVKYLFGFTYAQCTQANHRWGRTDCCTNPSSSNCNKPTSLSSVHDYLRDKQAIYTDQAWPLSWSDMTAEIGTRGRPFWIRWGWDGTSSGHIVVARGYYWHDSGTDQISTMDPSDATYKWYSWAWFNNNSTMTWTNTLWKARR